MENLMRYFLTIITIFSILTFSEAQVAEPNQPQTKIGTSINGLGLSAGAASGFGLSFRHHFPGDFSYQVIGGIIKDNKDLLYNIGGEGQYDFVRGETTRFFGSLALGYFYRGESGSNKLEGPFRIGLGIGGELMKLQPFCIGGELLFTYFTDGTILPLPQISAHYYFF